DVLRLEPLNIKSLLRDSFDQPLPLEVWDRVQVPVVLLGRRTVPGHRYVSQTRNYYNPVRRLLHPSRGVNREPRIPLHEHLCREAEAVDPEAWAPGPIG